MWEEEIRVIDMTQCEKCGIDMPNAPSWKKLCKKCYAQDAESKTQTDFKSATEIQNGDRQATLTIYEESLNDVMTIVNKIKDMEGAIQFSAEDIRTMTTCLFIQRCKLKWGK